MSSRPLTDRERAVECLNRLAPWRADDRDVWLRVGMALHNVSDDLLPAWLEWSQQSEKFNERDCRTSWRSFRAGDGITIASLVRWAGEDDPTGAQTTAQPRRPIRHGDNGDGRAAPAKWTPAKTFQNYEAAVEAMAKALDGTVAASWTYRHADGSEAFRVVRFNLADGSKQYRPTHQTPAGWIIADPRGKLPLYNLPAVLQAPKVNILEGEKCCELVQGLGLVATTSAHGANGPNKTDWTPLAGKDVTILPDAGRQGEHYGRAVLDILSRLDPPAQVRIVDLPGLQDGEDIEQWLDARDSQESEAVRAALEALPEHEASDQTDKPIITRLSDVEPQPVRWLWPERIPLGKLTLLAGDPELGKSWISLDLAARVTRGLPWPDNRTEPGCQGSVILMTAEDDLADTIRPRLDAAGADVSKVVALEGVQRRDADGRKVRAWVTLADIPAIEATLKGVPDCRLVVIDPVSAYLGGGDSHKNSDMRGLLAPLSSLAGKYGVAVLLVTHLSKANGARALYRAMGSLAFVAAARAAYLAVEDKQDPTRRLLLRMKNNLTDDRSGLAYRIVDGAIAWEPNPVTVTADDALEAQADREGGQGIKHECAEWLRELLAAGPMPAKDVQQQARDAGYTIGTLRRAREALPVKVFRPAGSVTSPWYWRLGG